MSSSSSDVAVEFHRVLRVHHLHLKEHWGVPLVFDMAPVRKAWFENFAELNEECVQSVSLTDMLFVIHCYSIVISSVRLRCVRPTLDDIDSIYARLRLLGSQSSPGTRAYWPSEAEWAELQFQVAWLVVFYFSMPPAELKDKLKARKHMAATDPICARIREARCVDFQVKAEIAVANGVAPAAGSEVQPGFWWMGGDEALLVHFVAHTGRVVHKVCFDNYVRVSIPQRVLSESVMRSVTNSEQRAKLHKWLVRRCEMQRSNDLYLMFRNFCFEASLPVNTLQGFETRKCSRIGKRQVSSELLDLECGFYALLRVHVLSGEDMLKLATDTANEYHNTLLLVIFGFILRHVCRVDLVGTFFFGNQRLHEFKRDVCHQWGMNMRPCILELQKRIVVVDVSGSDSDDKDSKKWEIIPCVDMYEAVLYWLYLMRHKYEDELLCSTKITKLYDAIFPNESPTTTA